MNFDMCVDCQRPRLVTCPECLAPVRLAVGYDAGGQWFIAPHDRSVCKGSHIEWETCAGNRGKPYVPRTDSAKRDEP